MENKYYIPDISEFHVGFEYEFSYPDMPNKEINMYDAIPNNWYKEVFNPYKNKSLKRSEQDIVNNINYGYIRCKYLDKEDIESLGFVFTYQEFGGTCAIVGSNDKTGIQFDEDWCGILNGPVITLYNDNERLFKGVIKNKSELKVLLKQLGILNEN